jgi:hypothetical protein
MTDRDVASDGVVRTALQLLPIPPHGDEFWARLEASLDAEVPVPLHVERQPRALVTDAAPAAVAAPATPVELEPDSSLAVVPLAFRRASNIVLVAVAAAAVIVVTIAGSSLLEQRRGTDVSSDDAPADAALETLLRDAQDDDATLTTLSTEHQGSSTDAVLAWVADLGEGDVEGAWAAMGAASQGRFSSQAEFEGMMTDLAEGYGAWSAAEPEDVLVTPVLAGEDEGTIAVVTLVGMVEQEGVMQARADAFPVRLIDGDVVLEPFASAGDLEVVVPEAASDGDLEAIGVDEELVFVVPAAADAPVLRIDGGDTVVCGEAPGSDLYDLEGSSGQRCSYLPEGGFEPGDHVVTVAFLGADGTSVSAGSLRFDAAA